MKPYDIIYLQVGPVYDEDVTWCQDQVNDTDVKYVRADINEQRPYGMRLAELIRELTVIQGQSDGNPIVEISMVFQHTEGDASESRAVDMIDYADGTVTINGLITS